MSFSYSVRSSIGAAYSLTSPKSALEPVLVSGAESPSEAAPAAYAYTANYCSSLDCPSAEDSSHELTTSFSLKKAAQMWLDSLALTSMNQAQMSWIEAVASHGNPFVEMIKLPALDLSSLTIEEWVSLARELERSKPIASEGIKTLIEIVLFDLCDALFRHLWSMDKLSDRADCLGEWFAQVSTFPQMSSSRLGKQIAHLQSDKMLAHEKVSAVTFEQIKTWMPLAIDKVGIKPLGDCNDFKQSKRIHVVASSIETPYHQFGGAGAVVASVHRAHQQAGKLKYWGYFPLYERDKCLSQLSDLEPHALVHHLYAGKQVVSTLYRDKVKKMYFVNPDPGLNRFFDLGPISGRVYHSSPASTFHSRSFYLGSSLAVFGMTSKKRVDIIEAANTTISSSTFELLESMRKPFEANGYCMPKKVAILHGLSNAKMQEHPYLGIGANGLRGSAFQLLHSVAEQSDVLVPVSNTYGMRLMKRDPILSEGLSMLPDSTLHGKMYPVMNGFEAQRFDMTDPAIMGKFACSDLDQLHTYKQQMKQQLFDNGIIPDPAKPLVIYVGRYSMEKGIDLLPEMTKVVLDRGGQVVVMGRDSGHMKPILLLEAMAKDANLAAHQMIRVYKSDSDQKRLVDGVEAGLLMRVAADLFMVPSYEETLGLVPIEANAVGCPAVLPYDHGFVETMRPANMRDNKGFKHGIEELATAYCYPNPRNGKQAVSAMHDAFSQFVTLDSEKRSQIGKRLIMDAQQNHSWYNESTGTGAVISYISLYSQLFEKTLAFNTAALNPSRDSSLDSISDLRPSSVDEVAEASYFSIAKPAQEADVIEPVKASQQPSTPNQAISLVEPESQSATQMKISVAIQTLKRVPSAPIGTAFVAHPAKPPSGSLLPSMPKVIPSTWQSPLGVEKSKLPKILPLVREQAGLKDRIVNLVVSVFQEISNFFTALFSRYLSWRLGYRRIV